MDMPFKESPKNWNHLNLLLLFVLITDYFHFSFAIPIDSLAAKDGRRPENHFFTSAARTAG